MLVNEVNTQMMKIGDMNFEVDVAGDPASEKLALFLHGFPETSHTWRHQIPLLTSLGYKCWAPNQRGYGKTTTPEGVDSYKMDLLLEDVAKLIDASKSKSVTLIAHDWGAIVAWFFVLKSIRPIDRLVIMNVPHPTIVARELKQFRQIKRSWYAFFFQIPILPEYLLTRDDAKLIEKLFYASFIDRTKITQNDLEIYKQNALRPGGMTAMLNWYRASFGNSKLRNEKFKIIEVPTLMIWGEKDRALGIHCTVGTETLVKDFTMRYISDAGHFVNEDKPDQVNDILSAWLQGSPVPGEAKSKMVID
jgi:pimeloyl-ACP methyl ester carboxylesterase